MIDESTEALIRRLFFAEHFKVGTIAAQLGVHHSVVRRVISADSMASRSSVRPSALDPYIVFIRKTLETYPTLTGTRIHQMLQARGYKGSAIQVRRRIRRDELRPRPREAYFLLETLPGEQGQCDWGHFGTMKVGNTERKLFALVIVLSYSRAIHAYFGFDQTLPSVIRGHAQAFDYFRGVPRVVLYDNMKTVVLERQGDAISFHPRFLSLASHYLFAAHPCRPARANEKGKVERAIRYLRDSFFAGREFSDLEDLRRQFEHWREHVAHKRPWPKDTSRTVEDALTEEREVLLALPTHPIDDSLIRPVVAHKQPYIQIDTNRYSVPWELVGKPLTLAATDTRVRVLHHGEVVATHPRSWERERVITDPNHIEGLSDFKRAAGSLSGRSLVCEVVPEASRLFAALLERNESTSRHTRRLLGLIDIWGPQIVSLAVEQALLRNTPGADSVAFIIDREFASESAPSLTPRFEESDAQNLTIRNHRLEDYDDI